MFCLRSWLPLLFIPTNASPTFIFLFFVCTYFLNRPCVYCSFLLLILFLTSCNWSDRCFFDFGSNWFEPRATPCSASCTACCPDAVHFGGANGTALVDELNTTVTIAAELINTTVTTLAGAVADQLSRTKAEWTGIGMEWLRSLLGRREWRIDCLDVYVRL
ncbi:Bladder cancer-related BC10-like protein [Niveomyces insectorum RCEF 264]|uniref:Bladder cancer-related BC10-like protein n=1 Tax=Niveomyces insectorum RCEF 264 TaxID=1081102 RepID=A0A167QEC0_9HYPO|nr:Bladder cancer-related BC10-like protein [Niveomyces insectorum RCEF 264]